MREGPICRCPECREGDIFELDEKLYTCTNCHRVWNLEEMYKTLWLDKLQKLIERRQALKNPSPSSNHLDRRIQQMRDDIMDIELLLKALEDKLLAMADDRDNPEYKLLERRFEDNKRHLELCHKRLHKYMKMHDELAAEEAE